MTPENGLHAIPKLPLRTHVVLFAVLLLFFGVCSTTVMWWKAERDESIDEMYHRDLRILTILPRLEASLDDDNPRRAIHLSRSLPAGPRGGQMAELIDNLQEELALAAKTGPRAYQRLQRPELNVLTAAISYAAANDLRNRRSESENAALQRNFLRTGVEIGATAVIALALFYFIVSPLAEFERRAREWNLGETWSPPPASAIPELRSLMARFSQMAERLNAQYGREKDLNEFKTKLVSLISHDFNNSLTIIRNAAYLLQETTPASATGAARYLRMIDTHTRALNAEVNNLLSMARLEAGKLAVNMTRTDGERILREAIALFGPVAEDKKLKIGVDLPDMIAPLRADPSTLGLVVNNLLSNAVKYTPEKGRIDVGLAPERGRADLYRIFVRDTGVGISAEDQAKILRGYYRTERGNRITSKGFGIGLSLSRQIIEAHGSELRIDSEPGKGSTFSFTLPVWKEEKRA